MFMGMKADQEGLPRKEFNKHLDALLNTGALNPEILEFMNTEQQHVINECKKALVRLSNKHEDDQD
jgi:hypothetical protein